MDHDPKEVAEFAKLVPELPLSKRRYRAMGISEDEVFTLSNTLEMATFFETALEISKDPKKPALF